ncbi:MAG: hypothetical protein ABIO51_07325 [Solirubrobacteraceae bacterium]
MLSRLPFFKFLAIAQVARLAGRHYRHLDEVERRRLSALVRKGMDATPAERKELRALVDKIDLRGLVGGAASRISPVPLPKRFTRARY